MMRTPKTRKIAYWIVREYEHNLEALITKFSSLEDVKRYFEEGNSSPRARLYKVEEIPYEVRANIGGKV